MAAEKLEVTVSHDDPKLNAPAGFETKSGDGAKVTKVALDPSQSEKETPKPDEGLLAGKFKSADELAKAYKELEAKLGEQKPAETKADPAKAEAVKSDEAKAAVEKAGLDMTEFSTEFAKDGKLSEASYARLAAKGIDKGAVDAYIAGQQALAQQYLGKIHEKVGGKDNFEKISQWAATNLTPGEVAAVNKALQTGDVDFAGTVLAGVQARYAQAMGKNPTLVNGTGTSTVAGVKPFGDMTEVADAIADPRYNKSAAYRKEVMTRLDATPMNVRAI